MSVNKYQPHVLVLPEDDADRQLANGFQSYQSLPTRRMAILDEAGGWQEVLSLFANEHVPKMARNPFSFMILLIDFDRRADRLDHAKAMIPPSLRDRVFVLGVFSDPEDLRQTQGASFESIGRALAADCDNDSTSNWSHPLLVHNAEELKRLRTHVRPILFPSI